jgi:hypothetical protein
VIKFLNKAAVIGPLFLLWSCNFIEASTVGNLAIGTGVFDPAINSVTSEVRDIGAPSDTSSNSHLKEMADKTLCFGATKADGSWESEYRYRKFVNEAKDRSLTLERCSGLTGRPNPFAEAPQSSPTKSAGTESDSMETRLEKLKKLEDAGLISKDEAKAKRKEILKNM